MLKCSKHNLLNKLKKLLDSGYYPEKQNHEMIYTIWKTNPKYNPSNYREITLTSCLEKYFSTLLLVRIESEVKKKKLLSQSKGSFRKL